MSRRLFVGQIADETAGDDRPRAERLRRLAREFVGIVRDGLIREGQVRIHGFGTFRLRPTRAHKGINPQTGERIDIPARYRVLFRPAKALRERIEPGRPAAVPLAEPHASREAVLGGVMSAAPAAGAMPAADGGSQRRGYFPDRIAAAAMADAVVRTDGPVPPGGSADGGSREANLGGTMSDAPSAGRLPPGAAGGEDETPAPLADTPAAANDVHRPAASPSREAALGGSVTTGSPAAGSLPPTDLPPDAQEPDRAGTVPATRRGPAPPVSTPGEAGVGLHAGASREAGLTGSDARAHAAGGLPSAEEEDTGEAAGFDTDTPLHEDAAPAAPPREPQERTAGGSRESALADRAAAARPAGGLPQEDPPWDAEPGDTPRPGTVPVTREGPRRPAPHGDDSPARPEGSREAVLGGRAVAADAAGTLPGEADADADSSADWVAQPEPARPRRIVIDDDVESGRVAAPGAETGAREERSRSRAWLLLLLLALLLAALAWWFWPRPADTVATGTGSGITTERTDTVATGVAKVEDEDSAVATAEPAAAAEATEATEATEAGGAAVTEPQAVAPAGPEAPAPAQTTTATAGESVTPAPGTGETPARTETGATKPEQSTTASAGDAAGGAISEPVAGERTTGTTDANTAAESVAATEPATVEAAGTATQPGTPWFSGRSYSVHPGDTLWDLADRNYVNPYYWPHIWNHNQSLADPDVIEIDQTLWLPALQGEPRSLTAADRRSIAEGYLRLYRLWRDTGAANPQYALVGVRYFDPSVLPPELSGDPAAGRPGDALAAAFEAQLQAEFPR